MKVDQQQSLKMVFDSLQTNIIQKWLMKVGQQQSPKIVDENWMTTITEKRSMKVGQHGRQKFADNSHKKIGDKSWIATCRKSTRLDVNTKKTMTGGWQQ